MTRRVRVGLLGCGTAGGAFVRLVARERDRIRMRFGVSIELARILVRDPVRRRDGVAPRLLTDRATDVIDGDSDLIVEVVGGVHCAGTFVRRALARGRPVVTANKALLAAAGRERFAMAQRSGVAIGFEASVCAGSMPTAVAVLSDVLAA